MVERSTVEQWFSILQFDPTVSQYIICIVLSSGMEGRSKTILWCAILLLLHIHTQIRIGRISPAQTNDVCISKKRIVEKSMGRMYFVEKSIGKMRTAGVKRFHGVQRHSRRRPAAQMAAEIEKRQKKK